MPRVSERTKRRSMAVAFIFLSLGILGSMFARTLVEFFLMAEVISITSFYIFFSIIIPGLYPKKRTTEDIFTGGVAKPPYLHEYELYVPRVTLIAEEEEE
ncbi:MAG: hypothetical protein ACTSSJ_00775 [Candidatus Odinarchaeia archaeon]